MNQLDNKSFININEMNNREYIASRSKLKEHMKRIMSSYRRRRNSMGKDGGEGD